MEPYKNSSLPIEDRVSALLAVMTVDEKIGQMTQVQKNAISADQVREFFIGSILSGGGGYPDNNLPVAWMEMTNWFQGEALRTRLGIPILYGVDAVHGHGNVYGAVIFPHNIGLGAARNPALMERIGQVTAKEMAATGAHWNFAPCVTVPQDLRWGRTFEGYGEDTDLVAELGAAYARGLMDPATLAGSASPWRPVATAKHFIGDGGTTPGTTTYGIRMLDRGDARQNEAELRRLFLPPYKAALSAGARTVMASLSSWNGTKMHAHRYLLTDILKGELGFSGFVISDWGAFYEIPGPDYYSKVVIGINAGVDMVMVPDDFRGFISSMQTAVRKGAITSERIDDAVRRILRVKFECGIFEQPFPDPNLLRYVGNAEHRAVAREAVRQSIVLLKNDNDTLPLPKETGLILVAGRAGDDIGLQCGGWTVEWKGAAGRITPGTTLFKGIQRAVAPGTKVVFDANGEFPEIKAALGGYKVADVALVAISETPYVEWFGDVATLTISQDDVALLERMRDLAHTLVVILITGRPFVVQHYLEKWDALVAAWLPGTEGDGIADVLFGDHPFTGTLPYSWPISDEEARLPEITGGRGTRSHFPLGFGLATKSSKKF